MLGFTHRAGDVGRARQIRHLFQGRFGSVAMNEAHLMAAARYVAPAEDWPHASVQ